MTNKIRIIIEKVNSKTNKTIEQTTIEEYSIKQPKTILDLGLRHQTQIELLRKVQQYILNEQAITITQPEENCPNCGHKLKKIGYKGSNFHAVFSDHTIKMQRYICPKCNSRHIPSIKSTFGTSIHPDLYKLQCEMGSAFSFFKSECQLANLCQNKREINNHQRIKQIVNDVGEALCSINIHDTSSKKDNLAKELIVQIDGGHIKDKDPDKRTFEALTAKVYRPESVVTISENRAEIKDKTCVASAKKDQNKTMQLLIEAAAKKQGMSTNTQITVIADGAKNCWKAVESLTPLCAKVTNILDWFHITKAFQSLLNQLEGDDKATVESIKWNFWHGNQSEAFAKLQDAIKFFQEKDIVGKLKHIQTYLTQNKAYLVNYADRKNKGLLFTSHVAESTVEHLINERHKRKQKMQWTRESAHNVLQIRTAIASKEWEFIWEKAVNECIQKVA